PVHVVRGIEMPSNGTNVIDFGHHTIGDRTLHSKEEVRHPRYGHVGVDYLNARTSCEQSTLGVEIGQRAGHQASRQLIIVGRIWSCAQNEQWQVARSVGESSANCETRGIGVVIVIELIGWPIIE